MRSARLCAVALLFALALPHAPAMAAFAPPTYSHTIGGPGHAGVYAWGAATAKDGTILIGDYWNYHVRRFDTTGKLLQTFGSKGMGPDKNNAPHGIAVSPVDGTIYVSDLNNKEIDVYTPAGTFKFSFANLAYPDDRAYTARMAVNSQGLIFFADSHPSTNFTNHAVTVFDSTGAFKFMFGETGTGPGQFSLIHGIDIGPNDDVYVADAKRHKILVFTKTGTFLREFGQAGDGPGLFSSDMRGIRIDKARGWLYVVDADSSQIEKFDLTGHALTTWGAHGTAPGQFGDGGRELALGADGTVFAPDFSNTRVNAYTSSGAFRFDFPNPPIPAPDGGFNQAQDVAADPTADAVYVVDTFNHRVQAFTRDGTFVRKWGFRGSDDPYAMNYPRGIAVDPTTHDVWVANTREGDNLAYKSDGTFIRKFGRDGRDALGQFHYQRGIWVGSDGRVYVADSANQRLQALTKTGGPLYSKPCGVKGSLFEGCTGVTQDSVGNIYAVGVADNKIYKFTKDGTLTTTWGTDRLKKPYDVAFYGGRLYVSEMEGNRISVFGVTGSYIGGFGTKGTGHGQFAQPRGISIDDAGNLYVMDGLNERVEVFRI
jgi:DNA-binding beta-propeller fold protein YncE